jgi:DNA replication protein
MMQFKGFPAKMQFTPVPNIVFSALLPQITEVNELKVLLHLFEILYTKRGQLHFTSFNELSGQASLVNDLKDATGEKLKVALEALEHKGALLHLVMGGAESKEDIYFLNSEANTLIVKQVEAGELRLEGFISTKPVINVTEPPPDLFTLYEQNIGMLTPMIADELKEATRQYPETWIRDAIKEAVALNKRNWRYILRILEHWSSEGKDDGTHRGNLKTNTDPDKYIKGKYGHMVQR